MIASAYGIDANPGEVLFLIEQSNQKPRPCKGDKDGAPQIQNLNSEWTYGSSIRSRSGDNLVECKRPGHAPHDPDHLVILDISAIRLTGDTVVLLLDSPGALMRRHDTVSVLCIWGIAMLSYHQDVTLKTGFGVLSQILAVISLIALVVFGVTHGEWWNFLIAVALAWLHIQLTRRWMARPGAWW